MRIGLLHPFVWPEVRRGAERYVDDLAWYLRSQGHHVELVTGTDGPSATETRSDGVVVHRRHHVGLVKLARLGIDRVQAFLLTSLPVLRAERYDVTHAMVPAGSVAARLVRMPTVFTFIGHPTATQLDQLRAPERSLYRLASRTATATTALSRASASSVEHLLGRRPEVLAPGVRVDRFPVAPAPREGPPRILFSAAPGDRRKRLDVVVAAMALVLDRHPDARLQVSGQGDPGWALARAAPEDRGRVAAALDLLGPGTPAETPQRYREATVTVLPAVEEAFGLVLVESLASGTPVVASADAGMADIVDRDGVGRRVPPDDPRALAEALIETIGLARRADTPATCARHARRWDWAESIGPRHEQLYERLVPAGGRVRAPR